MLQLSENPAMRPPTVQSVAELDGDWWVGHTKARTEKAFVFDLAARGIGYYLPMIERVKVSGGRKRRVMLPLFTSYVFFCGDLETRYNALATNRLCQVIPVKEQERFLGELVALEQTIAANAQLDLYPFAAIGRRCRVRSGPLLGVVGTVVSRDSRTRFILQISILGVGAALEIDADLLEPAE
jgi:transcriptional antiterminator RfaH